MFIGERPQTGMTQVLAPRFEVLEFRHDAQWYFASRGSFLLRVPCGRASSRSDRRWGPYGATGRVVTREWLKGSAEVGAKLPLLQCFALLSIALLFLLFEGSRWNKTY